MIEDALPIARWSYRSRGPFIVERIGPGEPDGTFLNHDDLHEALGEFWRDIGQPAERRVYDSDGQIVINNVTGPSHNLAMTAEVDRWLRRVLPPEVYATFEHLPHCWRLINGQRV